MIMNNTNANKKVKPFEFTIPKLSKKIIYIYTSSIKLKGTNNDNKYNNNNNINLKINYKPHVTFY